MTKTLVEQLRDLAEHIDMQTWAKPTDYHPTSRLIDEAADEIERLRAALTEIARYQLEHGGPIALRALQASPGEPLPDAQLQAQPVNVVLTCENCGAKAELPRVGKERDFVSSIPATNWTLFPRQLCPKCQEV